jgi:hypothetical protein
MRMSKTKIYGAVIAAVASGSTATAVVALTSGTAGAAQAYPVCLGVSTTGTVIGTHAVGPICGGNLPATRCSTLDVGGSQADVIVYTCLPN